MATQTDRQQPDDWNPSPRGGERSPYFVRQAGPPVDPHKEEGEKDDDTKKPASAGA